MFGGERAGWEETEMTLCFNHVDHLDGDVVLVAAYEGREIRREIWN